MARNDDIPTANSGLLQNVLSQFRDGLRVGPAELPPDRRLRMRLYEARIDAELGDAGRSAAVSSLQAVIDYVKETDPAMMAAPQEVKLLLAPLQHLRQALIDIDRGVRSPMLTSQRCKRSGRPPEAEIWRHFKAVVAVAVSRGMQAKHVGDTEMDVCKYVARALSKAGFRQRGGEADNGDNAHKLAPARH